MNQEPPWSELQGGGGDFRRYSCIAYSVITFAGMSFISLKPRQNLMSQEPGLIHQQVMGSAFPFKVPCVSFVPAG